MSDTSTISFGFACLPDDAGLVGGFVATYMFLPQWLFIFSSVVGLADPRKYFVWASWLILVGGLHYLDSLAVSVGQERPLAYDADLCRVSRFAVPDAQFVTTIAYALTVFYGLWRDGKSFGVIDGTLVYTAPLLYSAATVYTGYLSFAQLAINLVLATLLGVLFILLYHLLTLDAPTTRIRNDARAP